MYISRTTPKHVKQMVKSDLLKGQLTMELDGKGIDAFKPSPDTILEVMLGYQVLSQKWLIKMSSPESHLI